MEYGVTECLINQRPSQPSAISLRDADQWHAMFGGSSAVSSGVKVNHRSVIGYPAVWRGVNLLANGVAGLPCDVFRRDGDDRVIATTHPAQKLIKRKANPVLRARKARKTLTGHALLFGNGYAWIERDAMQRPVGLWPLDPQNMLVRYYDDDLWYATTIAGEQKKFPSREVLHITGLTHNGITGYSVLDIFAEALGLGIAAQQFGAKFFGNGSNMSGVLQVPGHFSEEKIRNTMSAWQQMNASMSNAHKVALTQDGVKFQPLTIPQDSSQFNETREFEVRAVVASILGIPPHMLGDPTRTSHNSLESEGQSYLIHSLNPWLNEWEGELENKLLSEREQERGTHFIEFNREAAVQMLFKEKIDGLYRQVEMGQLTINESRKMINLPSAGPDGDKRYHPANWTEIGAEPVTPPASPMPPDEDDTDDNDDAESDALEAMIATSVTDAIAIEQRRVVTAASKEQNFCGWLDGFYETWQTRSVSGLTTSQAIAAKAAYAEESKRQLLDIAGCSTSDTLAANVADTVATWTDRGRQLTQQLRGSI